MLINYIACFFVLSGFLCAAIIAVDIFRGRRQDMAIMNLVWPLTGLWAAWFGLWFYFKHGRKQITKMAATMPDMTGMDMSKMTNMKNMTMDNNPKPATWQEISKSTLHCGAGCTLADIAGEWFTFFIPIYIAGSLLAGQWVFDYILALIFGVFFQYAAIKAMSNISPAKAIVKALKVDFFSLTAWQIGMYGFMAIAMFILLPHHNMPKTGWMFWFIMQISMFCGFIVSYPVNKLLIKKGIKKVM